MDLEQWEIDLRNQLDKVKTEKAQKIKSNTNQADNIFLLVVFVVLSVFCLAAYLLKTDYFKDYLKGFIGQVNQVEEKIQEEFKKEKPLDSSKTDFDKLSAKIKRHDEQISALGMMINENFVIIRDNYNKSDLIFLNRDWKLNKTPSHIQLEEEDKEFLKKYVSQ
jgi:hypothetical protein